MDACPELTLLSKNSQLSNRRFTGSKEELRAGSPVSFTVDNGVRYAEALHPLRASAAGREAALRQPQIFSHGWPIPVGAACDRHAARRALRVLQSVGDAEEVLFVPDYRPDGLPVATRRV